MGQTGVEGINKLTMKFMKKNKRNTKKLQGPDVPSNRITKKPFKILITNFLKARTKVSEGTTMVEDCESIESKATFKVVAEVKYFR